MGKWGKYPKHYNPKWEKEAILKDWLQPSSENDVLNGKPEAYCKVCRCHLRAHHSDLQHHSRTSKHKEKVKSLDRGQQRSVSAYGVSISDQAKVLDLRLSVFIAMHCALKSMDHLTDLLNIFGKGTVLENVKLHRTKCSRLISNVIAPALLDELVKDIGYSKYVIIADESTDVSVTKFLAFCVRYFSQTKKVMVTEFLGIIQVTSCTGEVLAKELKDYLAEIKLALKQLRAIGTDGAPNMCGAFNSFYTHLKRDVPDLELIKCICHSLDKSAQYAFKEMPNGLSYLLQEIPFWFAHSAKRWNDYILFYKTLNGPTQKVPKKFIKLCKTRWLICLPAATVIIEQWPTVKKFFAQQSSEKDDHRAKQLAVLLEADSNLLLLTFLRTVLQNVQTVNLAFESTDADVTKLFSDLRSLVFSLAGRVMKSSAIPQTARPGVLRDEVAALKAAFHVSGNLLPVDRVNVGDAFRTLLPSLNINAEDLMKVYQQCGSYLFKLCLQLLERMPPNLPVISKVRNFAPRLVLARLGRPTFQQLPLELLGSNANGDLLESQWLLLGTVSITEICTHAEHNEDIQKMDIVHFWACVLAVTDAGGQQPFKELATFALNMLTIPVSNAVVERVFSFLNSIKTKERSKLQLRMLESLLRLRVHLKVNQTCCNGFQPTKDMCSRFTAKIYENHHDVNAPEPAKPAVPSSDPDEPPSVPELGSAAGAGNYEGDLDAADYLALDMQLFDLDDIAACVNVTSDY